MDAVEYVKTTRRMIANNVPMKSMLGGWTPEDIVKEVEQWAKEHSVKTRQSEFLKQYPDAEIGADGYPSVAPCQLYKDMEEKDKDGVCCKNCGCAECRRDFWLKEIK